MSQEKIEIESLGEEAITLISKYLDKTDELQEIKSSRRKNFPIFQTDVIQKNRILARLAQYAYEGNVIQIARLLNIRPDLRIEVLFTLAGLGAQDEMKIILKQYPEYLLVHHALRDISGAEFKHISLFQHCIWTKDVFYMANMMLDCLPKNAKGELIRLKLVSQYEEYKANKGLTYQLKGVRHENKLHFNMQPFITAFTTYINNFDKWIEDQRKLHWCTIVGQSQTLFPAHIRHHYCNSKELFWNNPELNNPKFTRSLKLPNFDSSKPRLWSEGMRGLGEDYAICARVGALSGAPERSSRDIRPLIALDKQRTEIDLPALIERLYTPLPNLEDNLGLQKKGC